jgi:CSLREA domain-containing protein
MSRPRVKTWSTMLPTDPLMKAPVFLLAFILCGFAATASAATLVVTKTEDTNDGICDADCSLREAVAVANTDDTVIFSPLFNTPQTIILTLGQIAITRGLTINGTGQDILTISGNNASRIFRLTGGGSVSLSGMKLTNGLASAIGDAIGGGIYQTGGSSIITNMNITNNAARQTGQKPFGAGGGICVNTGTLTIIDSRISGNTVPVTAGSAAGGIYAVYTDLHITGSTVDSNSAQGIYGSGDLSGDTLITVVDSNVINNTGSGVVNLIGPTTITNSSVRNNGGGIDMESSDCTLSVDRSVIIDNRSVGVGNRGGTAIITNSTIGRNANDQLGGKGGGIWNTGTVYVLNSSIINNTAFEAGGGVYNVLGHVYLTNSTVSGNFTINGAGNSPCPGGGIANHWTKANPGGTVVLTNSTVADNSAQGHGGGICNQTGGSVVTRNSIIAQNTSNTTGPDFSGAVSSDGNNIIGVISGSSGWVASDLQNKNPLLGHLGNNGGPTWTHALLPNSPAINAGNNDLARDPFDNSPLLNDQRGPGFLRLIGNVDIGAYEANYSMVPVTVGGRVTTSGGRGIAGARVTFTSGGTALFAQTNPFGYYRFANLPPGTTYSVAATHKYYLFTAPVYVTIDQNRSDLNFTAE